MGEIKIGRVVLGSCRTNCYFLYREGCPDAILIDPADAGEQLYNGLHDKGIEVKAILLTHGHFDHILGCNKLRQLSGAQVYAYEGEKALLEDPSVNCSNQMGRPASVQADYLMKDGDEITLCDMKLRVIHTPGHTQGSCCYFFEEAEFLISGDTIFEQSIGRTDLPTGSSGKLIRSIKDKIMVLDDSIKIYPGHGEDTTVGTERHFNPFLN